jgi:hypothetical protein
LKKPKASYKRKTKVRPTRGPRPKAQDIMCALCDQPMGAQDEWVGDIQAAVSLRDVPPPGDVRRIHKSCGEFAPEFVKDAMQKRNRRRPGLRLCPYPWSGGCAPFSVPIPNLNICAEYFDKYESVLSEPDALQRTSDLLLEFRRDHPVEWECCGWKNDAIADVALGRTLTGYPESGSVIAQRWLSQHWGREKSADRQLAIEFSGEKDKPTAREKARNALFDLEVMQMDGSYNAFAKFISWLDDNLDKYSSASAATLWFLRHKSSRIAPEKILQELASVYTTLLPERYQSEEPTKLQPSRVIQAFVARRNRVSPRLLAQIRAQSKKSRTRN